MVLSADGPPGESWRNIKGDAERKVGCCVFLLELLVLLEEVIMFITHN